DRRGAGLEQFLGGRNPQRLDVSTLGELVDRQIFFRLADFLVGMRPRQLHHRISRLAATRHGKRYGRRFSGYSPCDTSTVISSVTPQLRYWCPDFPDAARSPTSSEKSSATWGRKVHSRSSWLSRIPVSRRFARILTVMVLPSTGSQKSPSVMALGAIS